MRAPKRHALDALSIATYNIHLAIGTDGRFDPARIAAVVGELDADVVALQEVQFGPEPFDMLAYLRKATGYAGIAGPTLHGRHGEYGNAVLTRQPVTGVRRLDLSVARCEPRGALDVTVQAGEGQVRIVATHLGLRPGERRAQVRRLLDACAVPFSGPTVLIGDLNEWFLWGRPLRWLHRFFAEAPAPASFPARRPLLALDRVWVHPRGLLRSVTVHASPLARVASDHLPVRALIADAPAGMTEGA